MVLQVRLRRRLGRPRPQGLRRRFGRAAVPHRHPARGGGCGDWHAGDGVRRRGRDDRQHGPRRPAQLALRRPHARRRRFPTPTVPLPRAVGAPGRRAALPAGDAPDARLGVARRRRRIRALRAGAERDAQRVPRAVPRPAAAPRGRGPGRRRRDRQHGNAEAQQAAVLQVRRLALHAALHRGLHVHGRRRAAKGHRGRTRGHYDQERAQRAARAAAQRPRHRTRGARGPRRRGGAQPHAVFR
mmetsp:Transcript_9057/g.29912  ORF Transcript_9057/g.29912 Transcript_9057/m.29912 type:complete len:242 (-) Transcript_9057:96-821(-)